jgi:alkanesulfonate monooxygenase SsuD/methylene tetrahydromethanopterin reductase-like flavin-dependent oxidoreductase (luciferase family)
MREVERHAAALRVAEAAGLHGKLLNLHERSGQIADAYGDHTNARDAAELTGRLRFVAGLQAILRETEGDRRKAEANNTEALSQLKLAERRRDVTGERLAAERQAAQNALLARQNPILARKLKG